MSILPGNGNGTFQSPTTKPAGLFSDGLAVADFNGDGKPDLAIVDSGSSSFDILPGTL
ncbi:MAG TPA: VCBS repeat-containing protein [Ktedonobacteraceae bacterium]|nr:VCBS repeat-containing protein [Ktedonobacteraceae bacterium]